MGARSPLPGSAKRRRSGARAPIEAAPAAFHLLAVPNGGVIASAD